MTCVKSYAQSVVRYFHVHGTFSSTQIRYPLIDPAPAPCSSRRLESRDHTRRGNTGLHGVASRNHGNGDVETRRLLELSFNARWVADVDRDSCMMRTTRDCTMLPRHLDTGTDEVSDKLSVICRYYNDKPRHGFDRPPTNAEIQ